MESFHKLLQKYKNVVCGLQDTAFAIMRRSGTSWFCGNQLRENVAEDEGRSTISTTCSMMLTQITPANCEWSWQREKNGGDL